MVKTDNGSCPSLSTHQLNEFTLLFLGYMPPLYTQDLLPYVSASLFIEGFMVTVTTSQPVHSILFHRCLCRQRINIPVTKPSKDRRISKKMKQGHSYFWPLIFERPRKRNFKTCDYRINYNRSCKFWNYFMRNRAVPWLRLIAGLSPLCRKLDSRVVNVGLYGG
jgi:hypothetical protein